MKTLALTILFVLGGCRCSDRTYDVTDCDIEVDTSAEESKEWLTWSGICAVDSKYASGRSCQIADPIHGQWIEGKLEDVPNSDDSGIDSKTVTCSFAHISLPATDQKFQYMIWISQGLTYHPGPNIAIKQPGDPTLLNCPGRIRLGEERICTCQPAAAIPPATVTWHDHGVFEGSDLLNVLVTESQNRPANYYCTQYWMNTKKVVPYTVYVIDGNEITIGAATSTTKTPMTASPPPTNWTTATLTMITKTPPTNITTTASRTLSTTTKAATTTDNGDSKQLANSGNIDDEDEDGSSATLTSAEKAGVTISVIIIVMVVVAAWKVVKVKGCPRRFRKMMKVTTGSSADVEMPSTPSTKIQMLSD